HGQPLLRVADDHVAKAHRLARVPHAFAIQAPAVAVGVHVVLVHRHPGLVGEGQGAGVVGQQPVVVQRRVPARHVVERTVDATVAQHRAGRALVGALPGAVDQAVAVGAVGHGGDAVLEGDAVVHAQRGEDPFAQDVGVAFAGGGFDDQ